MGSSSLLQDYLDCFSKDAKSRDVYREWSHRGLKIGLYPGVFPSDSPYSCTTTCVLESLDNDESELVSWMPRNVVDLGCGNGAFAVRLGEMLPESTVYAADCSQSAVSAALSNVRRAGLSNVHVVSSDLFSAFAETFRADLIVTALPFADSLIDTNLLERFWREAAERLRSGGKVYFCWPEWARYETAMHHATTNGFKVVRFHECSLNATPFFYSWRVYVLCQDELSPNCAGDAVVF